MTYKVQIDKFRDEGTKVLYKDGDSIPSGKKIGDWDLSNNTSSTFVDSIIGPRLLLKNFPTRAVTGSKWDSSEMNWQHKPKHYAAIHFHEDDI